MHFVLKSPTSDRKCMRHVRYLFTWSSLGNIGSWLGSYGT